MVFVSYRKSRANAVIGDRSAQKPAMVWLRYDVRIVTGRSRVVANGEISREPDHRKSTPT